MHYCVECTHFLTDHVGCVLPSSPKHGTPVSLDTSSVIMLHADFIFSDLHQ
jgi:hypothetical protein